MSLFSVVWHQISKIFFWFPSSRRSLFYRFCTSWELRRTKSWLSVGKLSLKDGKITFDSECYRKSNQVLWHLITIHNVRPLSASQLSPQQLLQDRTWIQFDHMPLCDWKIVRWSSFEHSSKRPGFDFILDFVSS